MENVGVAGFWNSFAANADGVGAIIAGFGLLLVVWQMYLGNKQKKKELTLTMLDRYRSKDFKKMEHFVKGCLTKDLVAQALSNPSTTAPDLLGDEFIVVDAIHAVSHFFDYLGLLVKNRALDVDMLLVNLADDGVICWKNIEPYIDAKRNERAKNRTNLTNYSSFQYQSHFEYLANVAQRRQLPARYRWRSEF